MRKYMITIFALMLLITACSVGNYKTNNPEKMNQMQPVSGDDVKSEPPETSNTSPAKQGIMVGEPRVIEITAKQWEFTPSKITLKKGEPVIFSIKSMDVTHGFSIPDFNINEKIEPGRTTTIKFTPDKTGTFSFACSVFCGEGHSRMKGEIIVE